MWHWFNWKRTSLTTTLRTPAGLGPAARRLPRLEFVRVRDQCVALLEDLEDKESQGVAWRVQRCRNLAELWHLRPSIFSAVARLRCEAEAYRRLRQIDAIVPGPH